MSTEKKGRGRPTTRSNEAMMLAIWTLVEEEIHRHEVRDVQAACNTVFNEKAKYRDSRGNANASIAFFTPGERKNNRIGGDGGAATLRQRYYAAESARHDPDKYPHLHQRAEFLLRELSRLAEMKRFDMERYPDLHAQ